MDGMYKMHCCKNTMKKILYVYSWCTCLLNKLTAGYEHVTPVVAAPGSDITLSCLFPPSKTGNPLNVLVTWLHGETEVVHCYDHGRDKLQRQYPAYRGRTRMYSDRIVTGNASLRLMGVRVSDHGTYTCAVDNEQNGFVVQISLQVAEPPVCCGQRSGFTLVLPEVHMFLLFPLLMFL
ncbi:CD276 antigen-like isoform X1 [Anguilla anguilla]|uniref:CD276 antigen-like isoform X1 n=1 Tax=Anguilla anguilla TaxID=7936 RepID=UPI0015A9FA3A|nr:CD276 antigen-like isoform X1 [Anguilla anguilla]